MGPGSFVVAVAGIVFRDGRVLAMRRSPDKDAGAGLWETFSGRLEAGEQPFAALVRETMEETGLDIAYDPRPVDALTTVRGETPMVVLYYRGAWRGGEVRRSAEHDEHAWLTPEEFAERTTLRRLAEAVRRCAGETAGDAAGAPDGRTG